ncbi:MAG: DUF2723 domain-containing protein [Chitinophagaceae bacterium]|nr:DUF2723 domain-containing protein [Chitinophagaceae bacterium]
MNFNRLNNIVGWIVCLIACAVYVLTMEPTGSFWDTGEFISTAYKLQIPHPPGAPMFILLGRLFIILFGDDPASAARGVNFMSAIASGFTILFLFWTITHFARKIMQKGQEALSSNQVTAIMSAGIVGALAYTFSDSFWYSAVEGEVYALSSLFTAIVFWAILKWEHEVDQESKTDGHKFSRADRWLVFIFYMMGLSIGVHLLNLLTIPAIVMVYYFKRYKVTRWGAFFAFLLGCIITGIVQVAIIQWSIKGAGAFDIFFVNELGTPFFVGFAFYFILLAGLLLLGLRFTSEQLFKFDRFPVWLSAIVLLFCFPFLKSAGSFVMFLVGLGVLIAICYSYKQRIYSFLRIAIWSTVFIIIGYSTYFTTLIRSNANPTVDMYNVDNPVSLVGYLSREQYGDWPILFGPFFTEEITNEDFVNAGDLYVKGEKKYEKAGIVQKMNYSGMETAHLFPRMYDNGNERNQEFVYREFGGVDEGEQPTVANDIKYFADYQFRWMYWRYFMWNFAGKQNDLQGFGNIRDGNWNSGIDFVDRLFHSPTKDLPDTAGKSNKANNSLYFLPLILGIIGLIYQLNSDKRDFIISFLLFFFTGIAIVVYLNQAGYQPRERDYAYVGSFYAFAIWIGLGVLWVREKLGGVIKGAGATYAAFLLCLIAVPVLMASQEWDDHDRSKKYLARDMGNNYMQSCEKDAILITFGDNDTYPLWYTQEVEGVRPDLRVINYSLLGTDWYINQLRYKLNESPPVDVIFTAEQIQGNNRNVVPVYPLPGYDQNQYYDLEKILREVVASEDQRYKVAMQSGDQANVFPVKKVTIPVDVEAVKKTIKFNPGDSILSELKIDISRNYIQKNDLAVLSLIAANKWERPIYFTSTQELRALGLEKYVRMEGLSYRLVPVENHGTPLPENEIAYKNVMEKFAYGNAAASKVYFDEENRRHLNSVRLAHATLAKSLINAGAKDSAKAVLQKYDQSVSEANLPYGQTSNRGNFHNSISADFLEAAYAAGDLALAKKVNQSLKKDLEQQLIYYRSLGDEDMSNEQLAMQSASVLNNKGGALSAKQQTFAYDILSSYQMLEHLKQLEQEYHVSAPSVETPADTLTTPAPAKP